MIMMVLLIFSASFKFKTKIAGKIENGNIKDVKILIPLKYLNNFWRTYKMSLINCETNLILTWSTIYVTPSATRTTKLPIIDEKLDVLIVTLSTQDNTKLLQKLKLSFERIIKWNKYQLKESIVQQNQYLDYLINPSFQGVNRLFALSFENNDDRKAHTIFFLLKSSNK